MSCIMLLRMRDRAPFWVVWCRNLTIPYEGSVLLLFYLLFLVLLSNMYCSSTQGKRYGISRCRFVNDVLQIWERKKNLFRGTPIKRPHREVIVLALANSELLLEIMKGKELV